jgi:hypothetical protein
VHWLFPVSQTSAPASALVPLCLHLCDPHRHLTMDPTRLEFRLLTDTVSSDVRFGLTVLTTMTGMLAKCGSVLELGLFISDTVVNIKYIVVSTVFDFGRNSFTYMLHLTCVFGGRCHRIVPQNLPKIVPPSNSQIWVSHQRRKVRK